MLNKPNIGLQGHDLNGKVLRFACLQRRGFHLAALVMNMLLYLKYDRSNILLHERNNICVGNEVMLF